VTTPAAAVAVPPLEPPLQVAGEVLSIRRAGAYWHLSIVAGDVAARAKPGQFVALSVGGPQSSMLLRRAFAIHQATAHGRYGGIVEIVVAVAGKGTAWLSRLRTGDPLDVVGPLGRPFPLPLAPTPAVLVGGGYGAAPLFDLTTTLRRKGCRVHLILGAGSTDRLFGVLEAKRAADTVAVTTEDGSTGHRGRVTDLLDETVEKARRLSSGVSPILYGCGPMPLLRALTVYADQAELSCFVAVEETMACGIGVCMTCVLPVIGTDGITRMTRSCVDGPVFDARTVRWADIGTVPVDTLGSPASAPALGGR
jgi:dihydroorotate dehydrogenase electron transfer subunit